MSKFQCIVCEVYFNKKSHLTNHNNRINKCKPVIKEPPQKTTILPQKTTILPPKPTIKPQKPKIKPQKTTILTEISPNPTQNPQIIKNEHMPIQTEKLIERFPCEHCNKSFVRKDVLNKHIKSFCPVIKQQNKEKQDIFERLLLLESKNKELETKYKQLEEEIKNKDDAIKIKDDVIKNKDDEIKNKEIQNEETIKKLTSENKILQTITVNNNNINNNNTININIVSHGNENLLEKQVGELMLMLAAKRGIKVVDELISLVHFNPTFPEFQNIYLPDMKNNHMMVYDKEWILKNATVAIKELCDNKSSFIIDNINAILNRLTIRDQALIKTWIILMSDKSTDEYKEYYNELLDTTKYKLYNNKNMVIATKTKPLLS